MQPLRVKTPSHPYLIHFFDWNLAAAARTVRSFLKEDRLFVITNKKIHRLYGKEFAKAFAKPFSLEWVILPDGEKYKTPATVTDIHIKLSKRGANRKSLLLALGGGVVGDITGYVAATYMRGVAYVQMPTTLLAQVDSSVGGKTGVDLPTGKNLVGAFYQPQAVIIQTGFLNTLPRRELSCGFAEVIKYGAIWDQKFFDMLMRDHVRLLRLEPSALGQVIERCCAIKSQIVSQDEREAGLRALLNFGHTVGHAIEALTGFSRIRHGEAVAQGMVIAAKISDGLNVSRTSCEAPLRHILGLFGLPTKAPKLPREKILAAIRKDKKSTKDLVTFILLKEIGHAKAVPLDPRKLLPWL